MRAVEYFLLPDYMVLLFPSDKYVNKNSSILRGVNETPPKNFTGIKSLR